MSIPLPATATLVCRTGEKTERVAAPRDVLLYQIASDSPHFHPLPSLQKRQKTEGKNVRGSETRRREREERVVDTDEAWKKKKRPARGAFWSRCFIHYPRYRKQQPYRNDIATATREESFVENCIVFFFFFFLLLLFLPFDILYTLRPNR